MAKDLDDELYDDEDSAADDDDDDDEESGGFGVLTERWLMM